MNELLDKEERVAKLIKDGDIDACVKLLFELIVDYAGMKNFEKAESLKEQLYDVDAMAISEIVKAGEIIEAERSASIDHNHMEIWSNLYGDLSPEETNSLFYVMKERHYGTDEFIIKQGDRDASLYFVNRGRLKVTYSQEGRKILLKSIGPGDIIGDDTFFTDSLCTTSVVTLSNVNMGVVAKEGIEKWQTQAPALESKLRDYCLKLQTIQETLKEKGVERRVQDRISISGKGLFQLMNSAGQLVGKPFKGRLSDISIGDPNSQKDERQHFVGTNIGVTVDGPEQSFRI